MQPSSCRHAKPGWLSTAAAISSGIPAAELPWFYQQKWLGHPIPQTSIHLTFTLGETCWINTTSISLSQRILRNWSLCCRRSGKVCHWNRSRDQYYLSGSDCQHVWGPRVGTLSTSSRSKLFNAFKPALSEPTVNTENHFYFINLFNLLFYIIFIIYKNNNEHLHCMLCVMTQSS